MNLQNHIKNVFINIKPIYFCIPDMLIIWQLFSFLDEQTNTIPFHTKHLYIYTWCELKKDHVTYKYPIMIQQILDVIVEIWDMLILVQNFCIFSQTRRFMIVLVKTDTIYNTLLHPTYVKKKNWWEIFLDLKIYFDIFFIDHRNQIRIVVGIYWNRLDILGFNPTRSNNFIRLYIGSLKL